MKKNGAMRGIGGLESEPNTFILKENSMQNREIAWEDERA